ncbi:hypothetical protein KSS87_010486 [Heliosperma pusillum]|nr:hypothetical protein KSS87_010486 [Heliosperma pusillum]
MYPMYREMNSHPYQTPYAPFNFPSWEAFRPQMKEDGANIRPMPEYWPSNYNNPAPIPCQNCCAHGQQPQPSYYNFRPPCSHFPMPPSYGHYYGGYPPAYPQGPQPYPYVPPPYYSMEMPRYEFDKGSPKAFHCCECHNHPSHVKSTSNVKIEEQDPDVETKKVAPLIPAGSSSSPHPLMWAPPGYILNKEQLDEPQICSNVEKPIKSIKPVEQDPNVGYQWLPWDINSIKRLMEGGEFTKPQEKKDGDEKKASDVEKKDQNKQFSYPIIWMPFGGQGEDQTSGQEERNIGKSPAVEAEERNKSKLPVEERPPTFKVLKQPEKELLKEKIESGDDRGSRKTGIVKIIPVKQLDDPVPNPLKKEQEDEVSKRVKNVESVKNGTDKKPPSSSKKSKLPPICLRVDPPRKKNGKGCSRSPSPPGEKRHQASGGAKEEVKDKEKIQVNEVVGNVPKENDGVIPHVTKEEEGSCTREHISEAEDKVVHNSDSSKLNATVCDDNAVHAQESEGVKENERKESEAPERKILSETEAAVILQSAYRGYAVRRLEPLAKLREIADVKEEASKVSDRVEKLVSCVTVDDKEKVAIGEMIMNLLLKLDTIQGLHLSVRDVRKSVAKELIRLQEKLDSIASQVSIPTGPPSPTITGVEREHDASGSDEQSAGSPEIISEASKTSELGEKEAEEASVSEVPLSQSLESQVTNKEELVGKSHNEEVVPPSGSSSEYEVLMSCLEKKEMEPEEIITPTEDPSMEIPEIQVDLLTDQKPFTDTPGQFTDKDQDRNLDAEAPQENVEIDILRMEWECDLGAVKIDREETQVAEASEEIKEQLVGISCPAEKCDEDVAPALEVEQVAPFLKPVIEVEKHDVRDDKVIEPIDSEDTPAQSDTRICYKVQDGNLNEPTQESVEEVEDDICRMEWECDMGAAKFTSGTDQEGIQLVESRGLEMQVSEVENSETENQVDQLSGKSQVQSDNSDAADTGDHTIAESCDEKNTDTRESDTTTGILDTDVQESEIPGGSVEVSIVEEQAGPSLEPVTEVEKEMVTELPVSEGVEEKCSLDISTSSANAQHYEETISRDETNRRIIEENAKLRNMVEQLLASGKDQQNVISALTAKVDALEKKLPKKRNKMLSGKRPRVVLTRNVS